MISGDITNSSRDVLSQDEVLTKKSNPDSCHLDDPKPLPKRYTQESASRTGLPSRTHIRWRSQPERWRSAVSWKGLVKRTRVQASSITLLQNLVLWHKNTSNESISYMKAGHTNLKIYPIIIQYIALRKWHHWRRYHSRPQNLLCTWPIDKLACGLGPCLTVSVSCFTISSHADLSLKGANIGKPS